MRLASMVRSYPRQNFGSTSPLFSRYTSWQGDCVSGEQRGGGAETLSRTGAGHGNQPIYASAGCPKNVDNPKQVRNLVCKDLHTNDRISFGRETPNWGYTRYKYGRWVIPRVSVRSG